LLRPSRCDRRFRGSNERDLVRLRRRGDKWRTRWTTVLVVAASLAAIAPAAHGSTMRIEFIGFPGDPCTYWVTGVFYEAAPGEINKVVLEQDYAYVEVLGGFGACGIADVVVEHESTMVSDPGAAINAISPCRRTGFKTVASCPTAAPPTVDLGDGNDYLALTVRASEGVLSSSRWATVLAGPGNDQLRTVNGTVDSVDCGEGADRVLADAADELVGCEDVTRIP
jgi:hypothetical protein